MLRQRTELVTRPVLTRRLFWFLAPVVVALAVFLGLAVGARTVVVGFEFGAVADVLLGGTTEGELADTVSVRLPRTAVAILVGLGLAVCGAAMQGLTRNALADPGILGVNSGAAMAVVLGIYLFGLAGPWAYVAAAFTGAIGVAIVIYLVSEKSGDSPLTVVLVGTAITVGAASVISAIIVLSQETLSSFLLWQVGSLNRGDWEMVLILGAIALLGVLVLIVEARNLDNLTLGDESATSLGMNVALHRGVITLCVAVICSALVALAGPIGFVGLVVPHIARKFVGGSYLRIIPACCLLGPMLVLGTDVIGRVILPPAEVPIGVATAVVGAPVFIMLVRTGRKQVGV